VVSFYYYSECQWQSFALLQRTLKLAVVRMKTCMHLILPFRASTIHVAHRCAHNYFRRVSYTTHFCANTCIIYMEYIFQRILLYILRLFLRTIYVPNFIIFIRKIVMFLCVVMYVHIANPVVLKCMYTSQYTHTWPHYHLVLLSWKTWSPTFDSCNNISWCASFLHSTRLHCH
jgi:hypothetical protein